MHFSLQRAFRQQKEQVSPFPVCSFHWFQPLSQISIFLIFLLCAHTWLWFFFPPLYTMVTLIFKQEYSKEWQKEVLNFCIFNFFLYFIPSHKALPINYNSASTDAGICMERANIPIISLFSCCNTVFGIFFPVIPCYCCYYFMLAILSHFYPSILRHAACTEGEKIHQQLFLSRKSQWEIKSNLKYIHIKHIKIYNVTTGQRWGKSQIEPSYNIQLFAQNYNSAFWKEVQKF